MDVRWMFVQLPHSKYQLHSNRDLNQGSTVKAVIKQSEFYHLKCLEALTAYLIAGIVLSTFGIVHSF